MRQAGRLHACAYGHPGCTHSRCPFFHPQWPPEAAYLVRLHGHCGNPQKALLATASSLRLCHCHRVPLAGGGRSRSCISLSHMGTPRPPRGFQAPLAMLAEKPTAQHITVTDG